MKKQKLHTHLLGIWVGKAFYAFHEDIKVPAKSTIKLQFYPVSDPIGLAKEIAEGLEVAEKKGRK